MSDPTTPDRPNPEAPTPPAGATTDTTPASASPNGTTTAPTGAAADSTTAGDDRAAASGPAGGAARTGSAGKTSEGAKSGEADDTVEIGKVVDEAGSAGKPAEGGAAGAGKAGGGQPEGGKRSRWGWFTRGPWVTVGGVVVVLAVLAALGYVWGLGPMNRLNAERGITPPAKLAGLDRITDQEIREKLQLEQTRQRLSQINDGKQVTVEAYGSLEGDRLYMLIALRGKVDIDKTVADSGATPEQITKVGQSTCVETDGLPTQCYRGSNALTVIAQSANEGVTVQAVAPVAEEAFDAMK